MESGMRKHVLLVDKARTSGATDAQIDTQMKEMTEFNEMYRNPLVNIAYTLLESLPLGLLFTVVTAVVLRRKPHDGAVA
jgi:hypothetical protein